MIKLQEKAVQMFFQAILSEKKTSFPYGQMCWKIKKFRFLLPKPCFTKQDNILYLIDVNTKDRWIDEESYSKK
jgi:hypothetical protein